MTNKEKIIDIKYLIMECYSDKQPLEDYQKASRNCFFKYCDEIKQDLERLETLEEENAKLKQAIKILKDKFNFELEEKSFTGEYPLVYRHFNTRYAKSFTNEEYKEYEILKEVLEK